jgi:excisionase family DNA binding protein
LAIGRSAVYALLGNGVLASVRIGRSRRIPLAALQDYVTRLAVDDASASG